MLTLNSSKIYGPKGAGVLYAARAVPLQPLAWGGGQESGRRPGTENVPRIAGLAAALSLAARARLAEAAHLAALRDLFLNEAVQKIPGLRVHGDQLHRLPNNINITIPGLDSEWAVIALDARGIASATGSACATARGDESHVLRALYGAGVPAEASLRFSLDREAEKGDIARLLSALLSIRQIQEQTL